MTLVDISLPQILLRLLAIVLVSGIFGFLLAAFARVLGDRGPEYDGRLTINPFSHISALGVLSGVISRAGWISSVSVEAKELRWGRAGLVACLLASLAGLVLFAFIVMQVRPFAVMLLSAGSASYALQALNAIADCAIWTAALNLLPFPPLAGGLLLRAVSPQAEATLRKQEVWIGLGLIVVMLLTRGLWLEPVVGPLRGLIS